MDRNGGGATGLPRWIGQIAGKGNYVASPGTRATIEGANYRLFHACEAHNCAVNEFEVMFSAGGSHAYGMLIDDGGSPRWFGAPDAEIQAALAKAVQE
ncbi:MAG: Ivy family c-type lysozyme inhibitor [Beijerinckiaceae bacterium]